MSTRRTNQTRSTSRLALESLERRDLKAGNVAVWVDGFGTLNVQGDGASNGVAIAQVGPTSYRVTGVNHYGSTAINGRLGGFVFNNVRNDIDVRLGNGNDYLTVNGTTSGGRATLIDDLFVNMGNGNDVVELGRLANRDADDRMLVDTGAGADTVRVNDVTCRALLDVRTGTGNDRVEITNSRIGRMFADLGADHDAIWVLANTFGSQPTVDGGSGTDTRAIRGNNIGVWAGNFERLA